MLPTHAAVTHVALGTTVMLVTYQDGGLFWLPIEQHWTTALLGHTDTHMPLNYFHCVEAFTGVGIRCMDVGEKCAAVVTKTNQAFYATVRDGRVGEWVPIQQHISNWPRVPVFRVLCLDDCVVPFVAR